MGAAAPVPSATTVCSATLVPGAARQSLRARQLRIGRRRGGVPGHVVQAAAAETLDGRERGGAEAAPGGRGARRERGGVGAAAGAHAGDVPDAPAVWRGGPQWAGRARERGGRT